MALKFFAVETLLEFERKEKNLIMNDNFIFKTRTRRVDYRVFGDNGEKFYPESKFKPVSDKAQWDNPCVVMYEESDRVYVAAFGLKRGVKDIANRPISFSFYQVFQDKVSAWAAFSRLVLEWSGAEEKIRSLIKETPRKDSPGEDVSFEQDIFMNWLQEKRKLTQKFLTPLTPDKEVSISLIQTESAFMPKNGCVLKWDENGDKIYCFRPDKADKEIYYPEIIIRRNIEQNGKIDAKGSYTSGARRKKDVSIFGGKGWRLAAGFVIVICLIGGGIWGFNKYAAVAEAKAKSTAQGNRISQQKEQIRKLEAQIKSNEDLLRNELVQAKDHIGTEKFADFIKDMEKYNSEIVKAKTQKEELESKRNATNKKHQNLQTDMTFFKILRDLPFIETRIKEISDDINIFVDKFNKLEAEIQESYKKFKDCANQFLAPTK